MSKLYICPNRNCGSEMCPHVIEHEIKANCNKSCYRNERCIEFFRAITVKSTPKSTREYMRNR